MNTADLSGQKLVSVRDVEAAGRAGATELVVGDGAILTPSARDVLQKYRMTVRSNGNGAGGHTSANGNGTRANGNSIKQAAAAYGASNGSQTKVADPGIERLFRSPEAEAVKQEICAVGRKLWQRSYVDGNGGNISYRIGENAVICTPTLISKADLKPEDLCMVDLEGKQLAGVRPRTSEILLHLEIYKNVPEAKGVVHCHPPHATAYAITGRVPPSAIIPEYDVFIGSTAISPYETPGTQKFAETVIPFVKSHNTVLLGNHGIVCWADTVTHAEWYAEVLETYCWTLLISQQLGVPFTKIPPAKAQDLLDIKKRLGLPDARFDMKECVLSDLPEHPGTIALTPPAACGCKKPKADAPGDSEVESIVQAVTDAVMAAIQRK